MDDFTNVIKRDPKVQRKMKDKLNNYNISPYIYQSKIGYDTLIQNVIFNEIIKLRRIILVDIDRELKLKISRIK